MLYFINKNTSFIIIVLPTASPTSSTRAGAPGIRTQQRRLSRHACSGSGEEAGGRARLVMDMYRKVSEDDLDVGGQLLLLLSLCNRQW